MRTKGWTMHNRNGGHQKKLLFSLLVSALLQFLWTTLRLPNQILLSSRRHSCSCEQQSVAVTQVHLLDSVGWICFKKRQHWCVTLFQLHIKNCTHKSPGNWIWTITSACYKSPVVRATERQPCPSAVLQICLWFCSLNTGVFSFKRFYVHF